MPVPTPGMLTMCGAASMGFGGLNEVIEFFLTLTLTLAETNIGGYINISFGPGLKPGRSHHIGPHFTTTALRFSTARRYVY